MPADFLRISRLLDLDLGSRNISGTQITEQFTSELLELLGDVRTLWIFEETGTTLTDRSSYQRTLNWSADISAFGTVPVVQGSGHYITFDGVTEEGDTPDPADNSLSFGDGANDLTGFSIFALVYLTDATSSVILSKFDTSVGQEEWLFELDASDRPRFALYDDNASARIGRYDATPLTENAWHLLVATYDQSGASSGITIYLDGVRVDDTNDSTGTYIAMESGTEVVAVGYRQAAGVKENYFDGRMSICGVTAKTLSAQEIWALKEKLNSFYSLSI